MNGPLALSVCFLLPPMVPFSICYPILRHYYGQLTNAVLIGGQFVWRLDKILLWLCWFVCKATVWNMDDEPFLKEDISIHDSSSKRKHKQRNQLN